VSQSPTYIGRLCFKMLSQKKVCTEIEDNGPLIFLKEVRNVTEAHIALIRGSPYVPRTLQMQL
jgi:hypothetical protein